MIKIKEISKQLIKKMCEEIKNPEYISQIQYYIIKPLMQFIYHQIMPIYILTISLLFINIIMNTIILYLSFNMRS